MLIYFPNGFDYPALSFPNPESPSRPPLTIVCRKKHSRSQFLFQSATLQSNNGVEGEQAKGKTAEERQQQEQNWVVFID